MDGVIVDLEEAMALVLAVICGCGEIKIMHLKTPSSWMGFFYVFLNTTVCILLYKILYFK
jgi:hypothetical protein